MCWCCLCRISGRGNFSLIKGRDGLFSTVYLEPREGRGRVGGGMLCPEPGGQDQTSVNSDQTSRKSLTKNTSIEVGRRGKYNTCSRRFFYLVTFFSVRKLNSENYGLVEVRKSRSWEVWNIFDVHTSLINKELKVIILHLWRVNVKTTRGFINIPLEDFHID